MLERKRQVRLDGADGGIGLDEGEAKNAFGGGHGRTPFLIPEGTDLAKAAVIPGEDAARLRFI
ncbi:hypothetical protein FRZ61_08940 [Hypericibacter adhaerens]|uniref:Uncharacterized protein n=1 Tax=Hypericibacter adhaerens TaxID=2602016 RepID=A0A5J6MUW5_9PROT|nr:hypothetical protein FRZ61_08940 [Hypericibacter adhaerens]